MSVSYKVSANICTLKFFMVMGMKCTRKEYTKYRSATSFARQRRLQRDSFNSNWKRCRPKRY